jgi:glycine cleavage system aminomethyltransferase T
MGYVETAFAGEGSEIGVLIRDKAVKASVVKTPFIKR